MHRALQEVSDALPPLESDSPGGIGGGGDSGGGGGGGGDNGGGRDPSSRSAASSDQAMRDLLVRNLRCSKAV